MEMNIAIKTYLVSLLSLSLLVACGAGKSTTSDSTATEPEPPTEKSASVFSADSAYSYAARQVAFGPRVPGSKAHAACGDWLTETLKATGASVTEQTATLTTFDGIKIPMRNILGSFNPGADNRILLFAHWDSRPWADNDPNPANHHSPIDGANDGASGAAVLLELARVIGANADNKAGIDILLCDAEDWGEESNDESWAMGARYFAQNAQKEGYMPKEAILLDMVGAPDATFMREFFSQHANPTLADKIWGIAKSMGYGGMFVNRMGSAVNDDHVELIKAGIPAIDIIDYREGEGFFPGWHTLSDNMDAVSGETLGAVGSILERYLIGN